MIVYRVYLNRPQRDVPVTDAEIAAYKRTGRHEGGSGFSGYGIVYGGRRGGLLLLLMLGAAAGLAASVWAPRLAGFAGGTRRQWVAASAVCAAGGLYCAVLAGLWLREARVARHARAERLLAALDLPPGAVVLCVEDLLGVLGIAAARLEQVAQVVVLAGEPGVAEQTHINLRRSNVLGRARAVASLAPDATFDAVLGVTREDVAGWAVTAGLAGTGAAPPGWRALPEPWPGRLLGVLSFGRLRPFAAIRTGRHA